MPSGIAIITIIIANDHAVAMAHALASFIHPSIPFHSSSE
jgi:hypothetical protein